MRCPESETKENHETMVTDGEAFLSREDFATYFMVPYSKELYVLSLQLQFLCSPTSLLIGLINCRITMSVGGSRITCCYIT